MVRPICVYGDPVLREKTKEVPGPGTELDLLVADMIDTMRYAHGIGLAAPQVGCTERLFVVDLSALVDQVEEEEARHWPPQPMVFINARIIEESGEAVEMEEGCLSIPGVQEDVTRFETIRIEYQSLDFEPHSIEVGGLLSRVIQHEYDHTEGVLFIDHISPFRRQLLKRRLREMARGVVEAEYPLKVFQRAVSVR